VRQNLPSPFKPLRGTQYSDETATMLAKQLLDGATDNSWIAVVSAPSVFIQLKKLLVSAPAPAMAYQQERMRVRPRRNTQCARGFVSWSSTGALTCSPITCLTTFHIRYDCPVRCPIHRDLRSPLIPIAELRGRFDRVICDPPFLSADCQTKGWTTLPVKHSVQARAETDAT